MLRHSFPVIAVAFVQLLTLCSRANAEVIQCSAGDVQCLISAINQANLDPKNTTIHLAGGIYALTAINNIFNGPNGLPTISTPVRVEAGKGGATLARVASAPGFRILRVAGGGRLTLEGISLTGGHATTFVPGDLLTISGGAILNTGGVVDVSNAVFDGNTSEGQGGAVFSDNGTIIIEDSVLSNNFTDSRGGGLYNRNGSLTATRTRFDRNVAMSGGSAVWTQDATTDISYSRFDHNGAGRVGVGGLMVSGGTASILKTTFQGNGGDPPGAMMVDAHGDVTVRDSAFVENAAFGGGAGIFNTDGSVRVINTTFARNIGGSYTFLGIAVTNAFGTMTLVNSTFFDNPPGLIGLGATPASVIASGATARTYLQNTILTHDPQNVYLWDCYGATFVSLGNNIISDPSPCNLSIQLTDKVGDAGLGDLVDDGTPGNAHYPLLPDSEAIDGANAAACPKKDQLGRPRTAHCDIGAVEFINGVGHESVDPNE